MISKKEIIYLRELAKKQNDLANLEIMKDRELLWYKHNSCQGVRPLIFVESQGIAEMLPEMKCTSPFAQRLEYQIITNLYQHEYVDDDKVIPNTIDIPWHINIDEHGINVHREHALDAQGRNLGFKMDYLISDLRENMDILKPAICSVNREKTLKEFEIANGIFDDILTPRIVNNSYRWFLGLTGKIVNFMSMTDMLFAIYDTPDLLKDLMDYLCNNTLNVLQWMEDEHLLVLNNGNDYAGSGSLGFSHELPKENSNPKKVRIKDVWLNANSQETVGISPNDFKEFFYPYYLELSKSAGMLYYGCCEPVDVVWKDCLENLHSLRKVSISKWCNEDFMGDALKDKKIIYCRKPDPNLIAIGKKLDVDAYRKHVRTTLDATKGCEVEFSFRDIYTVNGNSYKLKEAVKILREEINR